MSRFVLDCSVTMAWCFEDEAEAYADAVLDRLGTDTALVPAIWPLEVANVLLVAERKRRVTEARSAQFLELLASLPIAVAEAPGLAWPPVVMPIGRTHGLSAYDAAYLDLAMREAVPLATLDEPLRKAAQKKGVAVLAARSPA